MRQRDSPLPLAEGMMFVVPNLTLIHTISPIHNCLIVTARRSLKIIKVPGRALKRQSSNASASLLSVCTCMLCSKEDPHIEVV